MAQITLTTNTDLNKKIKTCVENMESWGYNFPNGLKFIINEPTRFLGLCTQYRDGSPTRIKINKALLTIGGNDLLQTIYHELIHAAMPRGEHHGYRWTAAAQIVGAKVGLNITRIHDTSNFDQSYVMSYKYVFRCKKCGKLLGVNRMSKFVKQYNLKLNGEPCWWHTPDHGEWERIK